MMYNTGKVTITRALHHIESSCHDDLFVHQSPKPLVKKKKKKIRLLAYGFCSTSRPKTTHGMNGFKDNNGKQEASR